MSAETATYDSGIGGSVSDTGNYRQLHVYKQTITPTPPPVKHTDKNTSQNVLLNKFGSLRQNHLKEVLINNVLVY